MFFWLNSKYIKIIIFSWWKQSGESAMLTHQNLSASLNKAITSVQSNYFCTQVSIFWHAKRKICKLSRDLNTQIAFFVVRGEYQFGEYPTYSTILTPSARACAKPQNKEYSMPKLLWKPYLQCHFHCFHPHMRNNLMTLPRAEIKEWKLAEQ